MIILLSVVLTFLSRFAYYLTFPFKNLDTDAVNHLLLVKAIRANHGRIPERIPKYLLDTNDYPNGFHRVIALLPFSIESLEKYGGLVPIIMDTAFAGLIGLYILLSGGKEHLWLLLFPFIRLLWGYEVRAFLFGERAFGVFFGNIYMASALLFLQTHNPLWALAALFGFVGFSTTSQFTWQAVTFFTILLDVLLLKFDFISVYLVCFALAALITKGYSIKVLMGLIRHSYFYKTHILKTNWGIKHFYGDWVTVFKRLRATNLVNLLYENSLAKWVTNYPISIPFLWIWAQTGFQWNALVVYSLCGLILLPIIATETFKFWGEPERYLEYCILPTLLYLSFFPVSHHAFLYTVALLVGVSAVLFQLNLKRKFSKKEVELENDFDALETLLRELPDSVILPIPLRVAYRPGYTLEKHRYVGNFINIGAGPYYKELVELLPDHMGFPSKDLNSVIEKYKVDYLILHKKYYGILDKKKLKGEPYYDFSSYTLTHDSGFFQCYKVT